MYQENNARSMMEGKNPFGSWEIDSRGDPCFVYTCKEYDDGIARYFTTTGDSRKHYHLMGNDCWFGLANNHGTVHLLDPRRGFTWIGGFPSPSTVGETGIGFCSIKVNGNEPVAGFNHPSQQNLHARIFGARYYRKEFKNGDIAVTNTMSFPAADDPVMVSHISVSNTTSKPAHVELLSSWSLTLVPAPKSLIVNMGGRRRYARGKIFNAFMRLATGLQRLLRRDTLGTRNRQAKKITVTARVSPDGSTIIMEPSHPKKGRKHPSEPSPVNFHYKPMMLKAQGMKVNTIIHPRKPRLKGKMLDSKILDQLHEIARIESHGGKTVTMNNMDSHALFSWEFDLQPENTREFRITCIIENEEHFGDIFGRLEGILGKERDHPFPSSPISFTVPGKPWMETEIAWHAIYLLSSMFKDDYFGYHRIPQGSIYLTGHSFDGSVRDFCLFLYPLIFIDPVRAKEYLSFILSLVERSGRVPYALHGHGMQLKIPFVHSNPSDQYFFVLWAISEYVYITRDYQFLEEDITIHGFNGKVRHDTPREIMERVIEYVLSPEIGLGPHQLVRVRDGDWNDGITLMVEKRRAFIKHGESMFNSAMLYHVFPRMIPLVQTRNKTLVERMHSALGLVGKAIDLAWNGKWYFRGYDGRGNPLGDASIFLDHHVWLLVNPSFPNSRREILVDSIMEYLVRPAREGAIILHPPNRDSKILSPGWDVNGGSWHAINALLAWGLRLSDASMALNFMERMSMHHRELVYPRTWYGMWSGPDAYNAWHADRPGEAFYHVATPMCDFPFANNNLHAGFLSAAARFTGFKASNRGITIDLAHAESFHFQSPLVNLKKEPYNIEVEFGTWFKRDFSFNVKLPETFTGGTVDIRGNISLDSSSGMAMSPPEIAGEFHQGEGGTMQFKAPIP
ncbi:hypothetical protein GF325_16770 [Candidatus Bathyarchaeota archaeon]|nr:hypothetical protein [Candidatus Bathyarchaeota archaeon]